MNPEFLNDYDLLGIAETEDVSKIKSAYRKIVKECIPMSRLAVIPSQITCVSFK